MIRAKKNCICHVTKLTVVSSTKSCARKPFYGQGALIFLEEKRIPPPPPKMIKIIQTTLETCFNFYNSQEKEDLFIKVSKKIL